MCQCHSSRMINNMVYKCRCSNKSFAEARQQPARAQICGNAPIFDIKSLPKRNFGAALLKCCDESGQDPQTCQACGGSASVEMAFEQTLHCRR